MAAARNVLFVTADQLRADCLGCMGHPLVRTPHLDRLAKTGILFRNHFAQGAPCGPSRASLYTGLYMEGHNSWRNGYPMRPGIPNWASVLRNLGYDPVLIGYTNTSLDPRFDPSERVSPRGFEGILPGLRVEAEFRNDMVDWHQWLQEKGIPVPNNPRDLLKPQPASSRTAGRQQWGLAIYPETGTDTAFLVDRAIRFIDGQGREPWVLHVSLYRPHDPYLVPRSYEGLYPVADVPTPVGRRTASEEATLHPYLAWQIRQVNAVSPAEYAALAELRSHYYALVTEMDAQVGHLLDYLETRKMLNETLVLFMSDHGDQLGDHNLMGKFGFFDQTYRVPLIISDPDPSADATRGMVVDDFSEAVDVLPTLFDCLGIDWKGRLDGQSLAPILRHAAPENHKSYVQWAYDFLEASSPKEAGGLGIPPEKCRLLAVRDARFTYVHFVGLPDLLMDHLIDGENCFMNRATDPNYSSEMKRLKDSVQSPER